MPEGMNWDAWTGTAPMHAYNSKYDPGNWRVGMTMATVLLVIGGHTLDTIHRFLNLDLPTIRAEKIEKPNDFIYPHGTTIALILRNAVDMPEMTINWYDGVRNNTHGRR